MGGRRGRWPSSTLSKGDKETLAEIVKRFNAYPKLVELLDEYVQDDKNNDMDETDLSREARALLVELGE